MLSAGDVLKSTYEIVKPLGSGGASNVYLARHRGLLVDVVVKRLKDVYSDREDVRREADILSGIKHPYITRVYDYVVTNNGIYIVMDYIDGTTMSDFIKSGMKVDETWVIKWMKDLLEALLYLHGKTPPILHGDIKPSNIMIDKKGDVCLIDFNISFLQTDYSPAGYSAKFASPEQIQRALVRSRGGDPTSVEINPSSDIYGFGVTFWTLISQGGAVEDPEYSKGLKNILKKCMEKDTGHRYASCDEVLKDIDDLEREPDAQKADVKNKEKGTKMNPNDRISKIRGRGKAILTVLIITLVLLLGTIGCGIYFYMTGEISFDMLTEGTSGESFLEEAKENRQIVGIEDMYVAQNATGVDYLMDVDYDTTAITAIDVDDSKVDTSTTGSQTLDYIIHHAGKDREPVTVSVTVEVVSESEVSGLALEGKIVQTGGGQTAGGLRKFNIIPDGMYFARQEAEGKTVSDLLDVPVFDTAFILDKTLYFYGDLGGVDISLNTGNKGEKAWKIPISSACEIYQLNNILGDVTNYSPLEFNKLWSPVDQEGCGGTLSITVAGGEALSLIGPMFE